MAYLWLSLALLAGALKGYCGKKTSAHLLGASHAMRATALRMVLCIVVGAFVLLLDGGLPSIVPSGKELLIYAVSGVSTAVFVVSWLIAVQKSAYMMLDVALMLGVSIPITLGFVFFEEKVSLTQWLGLLILVLATLLMVSYSNTIKVKMSARALGLLLLCGVASGLADFSQKWFVKTTPAVPTSVFNLYTYFFCAAFVLLVLLFSKGKTSDATPSPFPLRRVFPFVLVMAICLFANSYFKTQAAKTLDAAMLYPLSQGASLILSTLMSVFFFKEKLTLKGALGILLSFLGLIVINVLG